MTNTLGHTLVSAPRDEIAAQISTSALCFLRGGGIKREKEKTNGNSVKEVLPFCSTFVHLSFFLIHFAHCIRGFFSGKQFLT